MEFLKLTFEWKLVIGFQQIKVRFGCKARTHESDREKPACALAAATEALEAPRLGAGTGSPGGRAAGGAAEPAVPGFPALGRLEEERCTVLLRDPLAAPGGCSLQPVDRFWERNSKSVDLDSPPQSPPSP